MVKPLPKQPEVNIGTAGHVDHGKTTLIQALTGIWTAKHSEELRRSMSIKVGYADMPVYKCPSCPPPDCYTTKPSCRRCGSKTEFLRGVSFVDCPGHEVLMTSMLAGAAIMDGAVLVIAADERVPQPQTREHLAALQIIGVDRIVIVQNKIDLVSREEAVKNYGGILKFVKGTNAEDAPVIPVSAQHKANIETLLEAFEKHIPTPERDPAEIPKMYVVRSFDVNKPGTPGTSIQGGVLGGSVLQGVFKRGDEVEVRPGIKVERGGRTSYEPLQTEVTSIQTGGRMVEKASCGGLVGVGTNLDPSMTKADGLVGNLVGKADGLPPTVQSVSFEPNLFDGAIGTMELVKVEKIKKNETLVLNAGTAVTIGRIVDVKPDVVEAELRRPICVEENTRIAVSRRIADRWRLIGFGVVKG